MGPEAAFGTARSQERLARAARRRRRRRADEDST
jgi:hypothetical protein